MRREEAYCCCFATFLFLSRTASTGSRDMRCLPEILTLVDVLIVRVTIVKRDTLVVRHITLYLVLTVRSGGFKALVDSTREMLVSCRLELLSGRGGSSTRTARFCP